jgi:hypothetical protein
MPEQPANQTPNMANTTTQTNQGTVETKPAQPALSPTETLKALNQASMKKDPPTIKSYLSRETLDLFEQVAQEQNATVDELLKRDKGAPFNQPLKIFGEKIEGQTAIVEVEDNVTKNVEKIPFVIENGQWKVAIDQYLENLEPEVEESESNK